MQKALWYMITSDWPCFLFQGPSDVVIDNDMLPFLYFLNLPNSLTLSEATDRQKMSCCVIIQKVGNFAFTSLSLGLCFWVCSSFPLQF